MKAGLSDIPLCTFFKLTLVLIALAYFALCSLCSVCCNPFKNSQS